MTGDQSQAALTRIEAALARIEQAGRRLRTVDGSAAADDLQARHDRLRAVVADSLQQLDALIEAAEA